MPVAGDRVAVVAPNSHRYLELYQAVPGAGMVLVPLNHRHADAELRYALEDSGARILFTDREIGDLPACVEHVVDAGDGHEALLAGADAAAFPDDVTEDDLAGLFYTGGTTGAAKGVMLRHRTLVANAMHVQAVWPFDADTRFLLVAPMFHLAGTLAVLATTWHAGHQVAHAGLRRRRAARPRRARGDHRHPGRPEHARGDHRGAARPSARRRPRCAS